MTFDDLGGVPLESGLCCAACGANAAVFGVDVLHLVVGTSPFGF